MKNEILANFEKKAYQGKFNKLPEFRPGDTVRVHYRISEGSKSRVQPFEGVVIRFKKGTTDASFTVRKISAGGYGVERVFPLLSPHIEKLEVRARGIVRQSRLYYLRNLAGKAARIRSKFGEVLNVEKEDKFAEWYQAEEANTSSEPIEQGQEQQEASSETTSENS